MLQRISMTTKLMKRCQQYARAISIVQKWRPEYCFAILAIVSGVAMLILVPPYKAPDEYAHLTRAYQITEGHFISSTQNDGTGGFIPGTIVDSWNQTKATPEQHASLLPIVKHFLKAKVDTHHQTFVAFDNTAVYSPLAYIPQVIGILLAKLIYPSTFVMLYLGRFCNLIAYIVLVYFAIRLIPIGKWVLTVLGVFPMAIQQAASLSTDVTTISLTFLTVSLFLYSLSLKRGRLLSVKLAAIIFTLAVFLGLTKQSNVILIAPFLFLPARLFTGMKQRLLFSGGVMLAALGSVSLWYIATKFNHYVYVPFTVQQGYNEAIQLHVMLHRPLSFLLYALKTLVYNPTQGFINQDFLVNSQFGTFSGFAFNMPLFNTILGYVTLGMAYLSSADIPSFTFKPYIRLVFSASFIAAGLAICALMWLVWTPVGSTAIGGLQGRYFLPLLALFIPVFYSHTPFITFQSQKLKPLLFSGLSAVNLCVMLFIVERYFYA